MSEPSKLSAEEQKAKIRARYKGNPDADISIIPAIEQPSFYEDFNEKRVAVYARVSTGSANQTSSYELQKGYYEQDVSRHPGWKLVKIYADEGISGTSLRHRDEFVQMIRDCEAGLIDLIVTKSVSRFARNVVDCISEVRKLASLPHPVGVFFETENIYTLNSDSEMSLSFVSTLAQEESHSKSRSMDRSVDMRFSMGIFLTPALLGYDLNENGDLVINEDEALTVRLCFFMYLYGYSCQQIAETLMQLGRRTKPGNLKWTGSTVLSVLQNERHCGDIRARKTWTPSYLDHKSKKNNQNKRQYYAKDDHDAIISRDDFIATQRLIANSKYGHRGLLPTLHVIPSGILRGFVEINPRWAGFTKDDYFDATDSIRENDKQHPFPLTALDVPSVFDLSGYEIARGGFFRSPKELAVTFSETEMLFTRCCVKKLNSTEYVELLYEPYGKLLAVRAVQKEHKHSINWARVSEKSYSVKVISGTAFLPVFYEMNGWSMERKYRVVGSRYQNGNDVVLIFDLNEAEMYINTNQPNGDSNDPIHPVFGNDITPISRTFRNTLVAIPTAWANSFGRKADAVMADGFNGIPWDIDIQGTPCLATQDIEPSSEKVLKQGIKEMVETLSNRR